MTSETELLNIESGDTVRYYPRGNTDGLLCEVITCSSGTLMLRNVSDVYIIRLPTPGTDIREDKRAFIELVKKGEKKDT